ncbi:MAG: hypothetical protein ACJAVR_000359 [Paracoccaceae bacterium]|jgi:hypothetical protein
MGRTKRQGDSAPTVVAPKLVDALQIATLVARWWAGSGSPSSMWMVAVGWPLPPIVMDRSFIEGRGGGDHAAPRLRPPIRA